MELKSNAFPRTNVVPPAVYVFIIDQSVANKEMAGEKEKEKPGDKERIS